MFEPSPLVEAYERLLDRCIRRYGLPIPHYEEDPDGDVFVHLERYAALQDENDDGEAAEAIRRIVLHLRARDADYDYLDDGEVLEFDQLDTLREARLLSAIADWRSIRSNRNAARPLRREAIRRRLSVLEQVPNPVTDLNALDRGLRESMIIVAEAHAMIDLMREHGIGSDFDAEGKRVAPTPRGCGCGTPEWRDLTQDMHSLAVNCAFQSTRVHWNPHTNETQPVDGAEEARIEAEQVFRAALEYSLRDAGPQNVMRIILLEGYERFLRSHKRILEADAIAADLRAARAASENKFTFAPSR